MSTAEKTPPRLRQRCRSFCWFLALAWVCRLYRPGHRKVSAPKRWVFMQLYG